MYVKKILRTMGKFKEGKKLLFSEKLYTLVVKGEQLKV